jgi:Cof subfamily protein (haloacid dehalogenase superfamily)
MILHSIPKSIKQKINRNPVPNNNIAEYKFVVFDLDGTLLTHDFQLLPSTSQAISEIRAAGFRVSVATGRSYKSAEPFCQQLNIDEPMVFSNGAVVDNPDTGQRDVISGIPLKTVKTVLDLLPEFKLSLKVHLPSGDLYKTDNTPWPDEGVHFEVGEIRPNIARELTETPVKMVFYDPEDRVKLFEEKLDKKLGQDSHVRTFRSHTRYVEMTNIKTSKGDAVKMLMDKLGVNAQEVVAVGDQDNDFEMLRIFGFGVMAGPGTAKLRDVCDLQIPRPEDRGIEQLRDWLLGSQLSV